MFKVVLWDYTGESANWAKTFLKNGVEVVRTLRPDDPDQAAVIMRGDWNFVLIFEDGQRELFDEIFKTMRAMNRSTENIVFANDFNDMLENPSAVYALMKPETCAQLYRRWNYFNHRRWHRYVSASAENFHYVGTAEDNSIMCMTYTRDKIYPSDEMKLFRALAKKYYNVNDRAGYFLDLGANIGTTGIYFCKKLAPNLKLLAFEPDTENFKLLRINTILNDMEDKATLVNCGLGDKFDEMTMYRSLQNPGANSVIKFYDDKFDETTAYTNSIPKFYGERPTETIKIIPLDSYLAENKIAAEEIKYIWIDTEGFEAQVLLGAKNLLTKNPAPVFMEFNPTAWNKTGHFEKFISLLKTAGYSHFIWVKEMSLFSEEKIYPLDKLRDWKNSNENIGNLGDIFLIKAGAI